MTKRVQPLSLANLFCTYSQLYEERGEFNRVGVAGVAIIALIARIKTNDDIFVGQSLK